MKIKCKFCNSVMEITDVIRENGKLTRYYNCLECDRFIIRSLTEKEVKEEEDMEKCLKF